MIESIDGKNFDVLVVGAGANGSAAALELSLMGYSVLLVDRSDFGSGTSSRSSRMLHCGFRSFEGMAGKSLLQMPQLPHLFGQLAGARESLRARADFVKKMRHRVRPVTMVMPLYRGGVTSWQMDVAAVLLKVLGTGGVPLEYKRLSADNLGDLPFMEWLRSSRDLTGAITFRDYVFDWPERICVDQALDAEKAGAVVRNYTGVEALCRIPDDRWSASLHDEITGAKATITSKLVLNLAGPWIDRVIGLVSSEAEQRIAGSKGVQIGVKLPDQYQDFGMVASTENGPFVCIPSLGLHLVGSTSSKYSGDPAMAVATDAEIDDLLARTNALLPGIGLVRSDVRYAIAGVRPGSHGSSRRIIHDHASEGLPGVVSVSGGTVAASRQTSRLLSKLVVACMGVPLPEAVIRQRRLEISAKPVSNIGATSYAQAVISEHAKTIADIALRRSDRAWRAEIDPRALQDIATALGTRNGWNQRRVDQALSEFHAELSGVYRRNVGFTHFSEFG